MKDDNKKNQLADELIISILSKHTPPPLRFAFKKELI